MARTGFSRRSLLQASAAGLAATALPGALRPGNAVRAQG
ncbi:MAG: twin-arginine translocation signal domain-containing protein, partial [Pseudomonadota bacterium]